MVAEPVPKYPTQAPAYVAAAMNTGHFSAGQILTMLSATSNEFLFGVADFLAVRVQDFRWSKISLLET